MKYKITQIPEKIYIACQEPVDIERIIHEIEAIPDFSDFYDMRSPDQFRMGGDNNLLTAILGELYSDWRKQDRLPDGCTSRIIKAFIDKGFNMNARRGIVGATCLQVMSGCFCADVAEATKLLLDAGAVPRQINWADEMIELCDVMRGMELYDCSDEASDSFLRASQLIEDVTQKRTAIPPYSCNSCMHLDEEQELKIWGHPCLYNPGGQKKDNCDGFVSKYSNE